MTTYSKLNAALLTHAYKRGPFKGDAPADPERRSRNHVRIVRGTDCIYLRMYRTDMITAYPDGRISIDLRGWGDSTTTRRNLNGAFNRYVPFRPYIHAHSVFSLSQTCMTVVNKTYKYYDGMEFNDFGDLLTAPARFEAMRIDKADPTAFQRELKESGFKDMFPVLYATAPAERVVTTWSGPSLRNRLTSTIYADDWLDIVSESKHVMRWRNGSYGADESGDAKACWAAIMATAKTDMYVTLRSDTTVILDNETPKFSPATQSPSL